ncbi:MAG: hypothetical protein ACLTXT_04045 [Ruminococcus callidus]
MILRLHSWCRKKWTAWRKAAAYTVDPTLLWCWRQPLADIAGAEEDAKVCCLGGGRLFRSWITAPFMIRIIPLAFSICEKNKIPCQTKSRIAGGNDSGAIHVSRGGVRTLAISLPCRYLHSPSCLADLKDLDACTALLPLLIKSIMEEVSSI